MKKVIVLGSGIQGVCCAFALHDSGYDVTLVEKARNIFNRTSKNQEGRLHMGFTYSLDRSGKTSAMVMHAALNFSAVIEEWFGKIDWKRLLIDEGGYYLIHKDKSLLSEKEIISHYEKIGDMYNEHIARDGALSYFGERPKEIFEILDKLPSFVSPKKIVRVIKTKERVLEMFYFRDLVLENLEKRNIKILTETEAKHTERTKNGFDVVTTSKEGKELVLKTDIVVNCLWNNRIDFDRSMDISTLKDPLYRFKIGLLGKVDKPLQTCSIISGAFGNLSPRLDGNYAYISWHPECVHGMTTDGTTPKHWEDCFKDPNKLHADWITNSIKSLSEYVPDVATFRLKKILPGIICSAGKTDIHDATSNVHKRGDHMGVHAFDGYYSIDTGKFSTAPLFAKELIRVLEKS